MTEDAVQDIIVHLLTAAKTVAQTRWTADNDAVRESLVKGALSDLSVNVDKAMTDTHLPVDDIPPAGLPPDAGDVPPPGAPEGPVDAGNVPPPDIVEG